MVTIKPLSKFVIQLYGGLITLTGRGKLFRLYGSSAVCDHQKEVSTRSKRDGGSHSLLLCYFDFWTGDGQATPCFQNAVSLDSNFSAVPRTKEKSAG
jgi:hypothetical protein